MQKVMMKPKRTQMTAMIVTVLWELELPPEEEEGLLVKGLLLEGFASEESGAIVREN